MFKLLNITLHNKKVINLNLIYLRQGIELPRCELKPQKLLLKAAVNNVQLQNIKND